MSDENDVDEIDKAEALLNEADSPVHDDASSQALSTIAIGRLLLYFAKEQRDAMREMETMIKKRMDNKTRQVDEMMKLLEVAMGHRPGH